ncbi:conserved hypothetical protein [Ricinus communis]|uniref:Uncharacterized protein n=1 Tax=Ricinus communis TaxID=3988 RepID=B9T4R9_RICCO|nr:conserved hypothetical protein [Ricinus communis]
MHYDFCDMDGHVQDTCFRLHEYPEWYKELKEQRAKSTRGKALTNMANTPLELEDEYGRSDIKETT